MTQISCHGVDAGAMDVLIAAYADGVRCPLSICPDPFPIGPHLCADRAARTSCGSRSRVSGALPVAGCGVLPWPGAGEAGAPACWPCCCCSCSSGCSWSCCCFCAAAVPRLCFLEGDVAGSGVSGASACFTAALRLRRLAAAAAAATAASCSCSAAALACRLL